MGPATYVLGGAGRCGGLPGTGRAGARSGSRVPGSGTSHGALSSYGVLRAYGSYGFCTGGAFPPYSGEQSGTLLTSRAHVFMKFCLFRGAVPASAAPAGFRPAKREPGRTPCRSRPLQPGLFPAARRCLRGATGYGATAIAPYDSAAAAVPEQVARPVSLVCPVAPVNTPGARGEQAEGRAMVRVPLLDSVRGGGAGCDPRSLSCGAKCHKVARGGGTGHKGAHSGAPGRRSGRRRGPGAPTGPPRRRPGPTGVVRRGAKRSVGGRKHGSRGGRLQQVRHRRRYRRQRR